MISDALIVYLLKIKDLRLDEGDVWLLHLKNNSSALPMSNDVQ